MLSRTIALDIPESQIAELFADHQRLYPDIAMGSYPSLRNGKPVTDLVLRAADAARLDAVTKRLEKKLEALIRP